MSKVASSKQTGYEQGQMALGHLPGIKQPKRGATLQFHFPTCTQNMTLN